MKNIEGCIGFASWPQVAVEFRAEPKGEMEIDSGLKQPHPVEL